MSITSSYSQLFVYFIAISVTSASVDRNDEEKSDAIF